MLILGNAFVDKTVLPFTLYAYKIQSFNNQGNTTSKYSFISITLPSAPCCRFEFKISNIRSRFLEIDWTQPAKLNGFDLTYFIHVYYIADPLNTANSTEQNSSSVSLKQSQVLSTKSPLSKYFQHDIVNLNPYQLYSITINACNRDLQVNQYYCLSGTPAIDSNFQSVKIKGNYIQFYTSQDRPQQQPAPLLISVNSTYVVVGILRPLKPNGIILLYQTWIRKLTYENTTSSLASTATTSLACVIAEWYDPNNNPNATNNAPKICLVNGLDSNNLYEITVTSSTVVGSSAPSRPLTFSTLDEMPVCGPELNKATSNSSSSIQLTWSPSVEQSDTDPYWISCVKGRVTLFNVYKQDNDSLSLVYSNLSNVISISGLNSSTEYTFRIELCNSVGCMWADEVVRVRTLDPSPFAWNTIVPRFSTVNSSVLKFDWTDYTSLYTTYLNLTYRLERAPISFAYPPMPLETGIRFHGKNFFKFPADTYFPQGYPYFGLRIAFKTTQTESSFYYATASQVQSEFASVNLNAGKPAFITNTQSTSDECAMLVEPVSYLSFSDNNWHTLEVFKQNNFAQLSVENATAFMNGSGCLNQVITDVSGVYIGGFPSKLFESIQSGYALNQPFQTNTLRGCLKNLSTILEIDGLVTATSRPTLDEVAFDFEDAEFSNGESSGSNAYMGCPIGLDTENQAVQLIGYGYLLLDITQAIPLTYQSSNYFTFMIDMRTQYSTGVLFLNYVLFSYNFMLIRLVQNNSLEIIFKQKIKYNSNPNNPNEFNTVDLNLNQTVNLGAEITNGYWFNLRVDFDFVLNYLSVYVNNTNVTANVNLFSSTTLPANIYGQLANTNLVINFYFQPQFYYGGFNYNNIELIIESIAVDQLTQEFFITLFNYMLGLGQQIYFSGCMRSFQLNNFTLDFDNSLYSIDYLNVRFDGCPSIDVFNLVNETSGSLSRVDLIYEANSEYIGYDSSFSPFTEYFYRVVAFNMLGEAASDWIVVRTPEATATDHVDLKYLNVSLVSGYQIAVNNISAYCYYCDSRNRLGTVFTGIINKFILTVNQFEAYNDTFGGNQFYKNVTFYCESVCLNTNELVNDPNLYSHIFRHGNRHDSIELLIDTTPITKYSLVVSVCTAGGCSDSKPFYIVTPEEPPSGVYPPQLKMRTPHSLGLVWSTPALSNGNITGKIE